MKASIILPILGSLSFACAYRGWLLQHVKTEDAFFLSLEALKLGSEYKKSDGWSGNVWLEAARLFGLAFYLITLFKAFGLLLRKQIAEINAQFARRDVVCIGDHPILSGVVRAVAAKERRVLWLGCPDLHEMPRGARMVSRRWDVGMVRQFRLERARVCVIAFRDDIAAVDSAVQLSSLTDPALILLSNGMDTLEALRCLQIRGDLRNVPIAQPIARRLHQRYPPFLAPRLGGQSALEVIILGRGSMTEALIFDILLSAGTTFLGRPTITIVARSAADLAADYAMRFPELHLSADLVFIEGTDDGDGRGTLVALKDVARSFTNAYVCLSDDRCSLAAAGALERMAYERGWPVQTIFVHQRNGGEIWQNRVAEAATVERLVPFGTAEALAYNLGLLDPGYDSAARLLHEAYCASATTDLAGMAWSDLPEEYREANRRQAMHIPAKLASARRYIAEQDDQITDDATLPVAFLDPTESPDLLEQLAELEHERWMIERRLAGWSHCEQRDDRRRLHPDLVPYTCLSEIAKGKDREMVIALWKLINANRTDISATSGCNAPSKPIIR
jgi:hypothetical protein